MMDRRAVTRVTPPRPVAAKLKTSLPARVVDISSRGAQLEVANCLKPNVVCEVRLQLEDGEILLRALVRRCRAWGFGLDEQDQRVLLYRAGLEFSELPADTVSRLRRHFALPESGEFPAVESAPDQAPPAVAEEAAVAVDAAVVTASPAVTVPTPPGPPAPRKNGPVKIRIRSDHVRKILDTESSS